MRVQYFTRFALNSQKLQVLIIYIQIHLNVIKIKFNVEKLKLLLISEDDSNIQFFDPKE